MKRVADFLKLPWSELLKLTVEALREGRMLSERDKWPWHVSRISEDLLTAYRAALEEVMGSRMERGRVLHRPRSAALWKAIYSLLLGFCKDGLPPSKWEQPVRGLLAAISTVKEGDVFNCDGRNRQWGEGANHRIKSLLSQGRVWDLGEGLALKALLFGWCEAAAFTEHTNYHEEHGPYSYEGRDWYVHEYQGLNKSVAGRNSRISFPFDELAIVSRWSGGLKKLDVFNNWLNVLDVGVADSIVVVNAAARNGRRSGDDYLPLVQERVLALSSWVERADADCIKRIFVEEWCRRTQDVYTDIPRIDPAAIRIGGRGPGFLDLVEYLKQEEPSIAS